MVCAALAATLARGDGAPSAPASGPASRPAGGTGEFAPFTFLHVGDPEHGSPDLPGTAERLRRLIARANRLKPAFLAMVGDLVHGGDNPAEWKAFDDALKLSKPPVFAVPGNHDDLKQFLKRFGQEYRAFTYNNCEFVFLNSQALTKQQLAWAEGVLRTARGEQRTHIIVVMHNPPEGNAKLSALLDKYNVEAVLCGHTHTTKQIAHKGRTTYIVSGTAKFRDSKGLTYGIVKVGRDKIEHQTVLLPPAEADATSRP